MKLRDKFSLCLNNQCFQPYSICVSLHSIKCWVVLTHFLGSNMDKHKHWVKKTILKFNSTAGFVHVWPKVRLKQPSLYFLEWSKCLVQIESIICLSWSSKKYIFIVCFNIAAHESMPELKRSAGNYLTCSIHYHSHISFHKNVMPLCFCV